MELSHRVVMVLSAQVQRQTNKTASEMFSSCLKLKSLQSLKLFNKPITTTIISNLMIVNSSKTKCLHFVGKQHVLLKVSQPLENVNLGVFMLVGYFGGFRTFRQKTFGKNMAADVSAKKYAEMSQAKNICRNV